MNNIYGRLLFKRASLVAQTVKDLPTMQEIKLDPWVGKILWKRDGFPLQHSCLENPIDGGAR